MEVSNSYYIVLWSLLFDMKIIIVEENAFQLSTLITNLGHFLNSFVTWFAKVNLKMFGTRVIGK